MKKILGLVFGLLFTLPAFATDLDPCRNLFDGQIEQGGISHANGTLAPSSTKRLYSVNFIDIQPNTSYALSAVVTEKIKQGMIFFYDNNENFIGMGSNIWVNLPFSATSPANAYKARFVLTQSDEGTILTPSDAQNVQFEQGSTATEYSAFCPPIKVATKKYNDTAFSPVVTALNSAISTIKSVVTNTINQAAAVSALQTSKQTMPNASATNGTCPNYKQCLLVETSDGTPQWFVITDPFRDFVTPILATNTNGTTSTNDPGYQQVEYLQSSGRQYIDTGVVPNATQFGLNVKFKFDTKPNTQASFVAGSANSSDPLLWNTVLYLNDEIAIQYQKDGVTYNSIPFTTDVLDFSYSIADNVIITRINSVSNTDSCAVYNANNNSIYLFARHDTGAAMYGSVKIYSASLTSNNTLVRNFVPVRRLSDSALGMYDTVSKTFFPNAGDGDFTAGPDVTNDPDVPANPTWSVTWGNNGDNVAGTVYGEGKCNNSSSDATNTTEGAQCWCKTTGATVNQESTPVSSAPWMFLTTFASSSACTEGCGNYCATNVRVSAAFRSRLFNTGS